MSAEEATELERIGGGSESKKSTQGRKANS
jgi:hypothetical protein